MVKRERTNEKIRKVEKKKKKRRTDKINCKSRKNSIKGQLSERNR